MKFLFFSTVSVLLGTIFSCTEDEIVKSIEAKYKEFDVSVLMVDGDGETEDPDSLLTVEQLKTKYRFHEIYDKYSDVVDGKMVFRMSEEEWLLTGLPEYYYHFIIDGFSSSNRYVSSINDTERNKLNDAIYKGWATYRKAWRTRYAKVKHLIED